MIAHDVMTYVSARSVGFRDVPVTLRPYSYGEVDRDRYNPSYAWEMREGGTPVVSSDNPYFDEQEYYGSSVRYSVLRGDEASRDDAVSALEVLSLYSAEPDWGMDRELELSPLQKLTAGSQGYRHLRYGFFLFRAGVAHRRALHFQSLAAHAFDRGDPYWGLRFSARALHYIQDILSPYHLKPIPEWYWIPRLFRLRAVYHTIFNYHLNFEGYTGYHLWHGTQRFIRCIEGAGPKAIGDLKQDLLRASWKVRMLFYGIFGECRKMWGESLSEGFRRLGRDWIEEYTPSERLNLLICRWLTLASSYVKGYILKDVLPYMEKGNR